MNSLLDLVGHRQFILLTLTLAFGQASFYAHLGASSFVFLVHFGLAPWQYSALFAIEAAGRAGSAQIAPLLMRRFDQGWTITTGPWSDLIRAILPPSKGTRLLDGPRLAPASGRVPTALVVLVHGYGSNGDDLISLAAMIQPGLPDVAFVAPNAPSQIPRMANAHQWWAIDTFSPTERTTGAAAAAPALDAFLTNELDATGLPSNRLLLVGFSQGTMMSLHVGLRRPEDIAGIIGISGMLVAPEQLQASIRSRPPVLLIHGTEDEVVPFRSLDLASKSLTEAGVAVETHVSPGLGHTIGPDGLAAAAAFARRALG